MTAAYRFLKFISGGVLILILIFVILASCRAIPVKAPASQSTISSTNSEYPPPEETIIVQSPTATETDTSPIIPKTITPVPITPFPTLTLVPGPSPTPLPIVEPAKDAAGTLFFLTKEGEDHMAAIHSLAVDSNGSAEGPATKISNDVPRGDGFVFPSPNGEYLAILQPWGFFSIYNTQQGAFVETALTSLGGDGFFFNWYPDNRRILWGAGSLVLSDPISGKHTVLAVPGYGEVTAAAASPDGQYVVYAYNTDVVYPKGLWVVNTNGQDAHLLVEGINPLHLIWSPDGKQIAFNEYGWQVVNADGSNLRELAPGVILPQCHQLPAAWSPDSQNLAVVTSQSGQAFCHGWTNDVFKDTNIYLIDVGSGKARSLVPDDSLGNIDPGWSPDGSQIAFVSSRSGDPEIWVINVDGSDLRVITASKNLIRFPVWSKSKE